MKNKSYLSLFLIILFSCVLSYSCKTPEGCEATEKMQESMHSGSDKPGKSNLFSKKQRKRMKSRSN